MKRLLAYCILACLIFLSSPRVLFHEHEDSSEILDDHETSPKDDCFVCEFDLGTFTTSKILNFKIYQVRPHANILKSVSTNSSNEFDSFQHRGPPAIIA